MGEDDARKVQADEQGGNTTELSDEELNAIKESQEDEETSPADDPDVS